MFAGGRPGFPVGGFSPIDAIAGEHVRGPDGAIAG